MKKRGIMGCGRKEGRKQVDPPIAPARVEKTPAVALKRMQVLI